MAAGYEEFCVPREEELVREALALVGLKAGESFLDVGAGPGSLSLPAARLGAKVIATDWSPAMIERLDARVREERLSEADGRVMDCHSLDLPDGTFDVTAPQFCVMQEVPDETKALHEIVRVTKPGGRVLIVAYRHPEKFEVPRWFLAAVKAVVPDFPEPEVDAPFWVWDSDLLRSRLSEAGLRDISVTPTAERGVFGSGQERSSRAP